MINSPFVSFNLRAFNKMLSHRSTKQKQKEIHKIETEEEEKKGNIVF